MSTTSFRRGLQIAAWAIASLSSSAFLLATGAWTGAVLAPGLWHTKALARFPVDDGFRLLSSLLAHCAIFMACRRVPGMDHARALLGVLPFVSTA